jgi:hypothetical protein
VRTTALLLRFLLELALVTSAAYAAWALSHGGWRPLLAALAASAVIALWGTLLSPRAPVPIPAWARVTLEALLFGGVGFLLWQAGAPTTGTALAALWALDRLVLRLTKDAPSVLEGRERAKASEPPREP